VSAHIYIEGAAKKAAHSKEQQIRCREAFRNLFVKMGFAERLPRTSACGGRSEVFKDFKKALKCKKAGYVAMLVDSEEPVADIEKTWEHLETRPGDEWEKPAGVADEQVLLMTTCMETLIVSDRVALRGHYGAMLQEGTALPPLVDLEHRHRHDIQDALFHATRNCRNAYEKGERSFEILGKLNPDVLCQHLPSFMRIKRILSKKLVLRPSPKHQNW